ncbi:MAG: tRNA threonylcarbamoyladenosine dehydratase [Clostridia bacterium]|nr:tRNA threonylcarbamoyladenosine dehydratase [Clostridia bacterium]
MEETRDDRTRLLLGDAGLTALKNAHVTVVGVGGVGGHCTEALARAGVGRMCLIDADVVAPSNLNRQLFATKSTLGMPKAEAAKLRLSEVSETEVTTVKVFLTPENIGEYIPQETDCIADCCDSVPAKVALALYGKEHGIPVVAALGAGNRLDPSAFRVTDIFETSGCPLARKLRYELRKAGVKRLDVVVSDEEPKKGKPGDPVGSIATVPGASGLVLASRVIALLTAQTKQ